MGIQLLFPQSQPPAKSCTPIKEDSKEEELEKKE